MTDDNDAPTPKSSGTLAVFETTCAEAIEKLDSCEPTDVTLDLRREAVALQALFRSWTMRAPKPEERASAVTRLMDLHRAVEEYVVRHLARRGGS